MTIETVTAEEFMTKLREEISSVFSLAALMGRTKDEMLEVLFKLYWLDTVRPPERSKVLPSDKSGVHKFSGLWCNEMRWVFALLGGDDCIVIEEQSEDGDISTCVIKHDWDYVRIGGHFRSDRRNQSHYTFISRGYYGFVDYFPVSSEPVLDRVNDLLQNVKWIDGSVKDFKKAMNDPLPVGTLEYV